MCLICNSLDVSGFSRRFYSSLFKQLQIRHFLPRYLALIHSSIYVYFPSIKSMTDNYHAKRFTLAEFSSSEKAGDYSNDQRFRQKKSAWFMSFVRSVTTENREWESGLLIFSVAPRLNSYRFAQWVEDTIDERSRQGFRGLLVETDARFWGRGGHE